MNVQFELLKKESPVVNVLERCGWVVNEQTTGAVVCSHPSVSTEKDARFKLYQDGLLLSPLLRIFFKR
jgi:hypothetical protein